LVNATEKQRPWLLVAKLIFKMPAAYLASIEQAVICPIPCEWLGTKVPASTHPDLQLLSDQY
jgi:hypothetical protein